MKSKLLHIALIILISGLGTYAQNGWEIIHEAIYIRDIEFFDAETGLMTTDEGIYKTRDGGEFWQKISNNVGSLDFLDEENGRLYVWGNNHYLFTHDGGFSWQIISIDNREDLSYVRLLSPTSILASIDYQLWYISDDAGSSWRQISIPSENFNGILQFIDTSKGYYSIYNEVTDKIDILFTTDQGQNWNYANLPDSLDQFQIHLSDDNQLYLATKFSLFKVDPFFQEIEFISSLPPGYPSHLWVYDDTVFLLNGNNIFYKMDIDRKIWEELVKPKELSYTSGPKFFYKNNNGFMVFGAPEWGAEPASFLYKSDNCCLEWIGLNRYYNYSYLYISPFSISVVGKSRGRHYGISNTYLLDIMSGEFNNTFYGSYHLTFPIAWELYNGRGAGEFYLFQITEGNLELQPLEMPFERAALIFLSEENNLYVLVGEQDGEAIIWSVYKSSNLGSSWETLHQWQSTDERHIQNMYAFPNDKVILYGNEGLITLVENQSVKTIDTNTSFPLMDIDFVNDYTGWVGGGFIEGYYDEESEQHYNFYRNALLKTTNGGKSWVELPKTPYYFNDFNFIDVVNGWAVGFDTLTQKGVIVRTTNGGNSWNLEVGDLYAPLNKIEFKDSIGIAVGDGGLILGYNLNLENNNPETNLSETFTFRNYPNPLSSFTFFEFESSVSGKLTLKIFDLSGKLVSEYSHGNVANEKLSLIWINPGLESGVYLVVADIDGMKQSIKIVIEN